MIVYTVYEPSHPAQALNARAEEVAFVKEGFTWWGLLFAPFWLLFNALWFEFIAAVLVGSGAAAGLTALGLSDDAGGIAYFLLMLLVGFEGNGLRRWRLERKGYVYLASVAGHSLEECERRFFDAWLPSLSGDRSKPATKPGPDITPSSWGDWPGPGAIGTLPGEVL
ncbi:MAG: DUF2628 domain-containing protein [Rhodomicrobium sp.]